MTNTTAKEQAIRIEEAMTTFQFPNGVPGFPELKEFYIKDLQEGIYDPLKVMVSIDNPSVSFILYPHHNGHSLLSTQDQATLVNACQITGEGAELYSVVTVREPNGHLALTTNLKAPIVLDTKEQKGWQHILTNSENELNFPLVEMSKDLQEIRKQHK